jgi:hypothetical protein
MTSEQYQSDDELLASAARFAAEAEVARECGAYHGAGQLFLQASETIGKMGGREDHKELRARYLTEVSRCIKELLR